MKSQKIALTTLALLASLACAISCSKLSAEKSVGPSGKELKSAAADQGFPFPAGTVFTENTDNIQFQLPSGSVMYGFDPAGQLSIGTKGSVTCTCAGNGGCKPFAAGGKWGCMIDGCKECTGKASLQGTTALDFFLIQNGERNGNSSLVFLSDSRPIYEIEEWNQTPFAQAADVATESFKQAIDDLNEYIDANFTRTNMVAIPFYHNGKKVIVDVPFAAVEPGMLYTLSISTGGYSCSGSCGSSKCKKETAGMGQVVYCDGCSSGCSLKSSYAAY